MKASAVAYPIQGLVKYHGLKDTAKRIPYHDSISVCTGPIHTHTTIETMDAGHASATIDGQPATGTAMQRVLAVVNEVRRRAYNHRPFRMESINDFPQFVGLGSSSSGFAALAVAAAKAYGLKATASELSAIARLGAGSASRSVAGGVSEWVTRGVRSRATQLLRHDDLDWRIIVPLVSHPEPTDVVHAEAPSSPFFETRCRTIKRTLAEARDAIHHRDLEHLWDVAERDTLNLHAVTMTGTGRRITWRPTTLAVIEQVRRLRSQGVPVYFSIDTGATAYCNTNAAYDDEVATVMEQVPGVERILRLRPAGPARLVDEDLF